MMDSSTRLRFEKLEEKKLLAGDVAVSVVAGALIVEGDELGNQVAISSGGAPGEYIVTGLDGTTVHLEGEEIPETEEDSNEVVVTGVRRGIHVATHEGDDTVIVEDARIRGNLTIRTGEGEDHVRVGPDSLSLDVAELEEDVPRANVAIGRSLLIRTGTENDTVQLGGPVAGSQDIEEDAQPARALTVRGHTFVGLGDGEDSLVVDAVHGRWGLTANGGLGGDEIDVANSRFRMLGLRGGSGDATDSISVDNVRARMAGISTGGGQDNVEITDSAFGVLAAHMGAGDDTLSISGSEARLAVLLGGSGEADAYNDNGGNSFQRQIVRGFEFPEPIDDDEDGE